MFLFQRKSYKSLFLRGRSFFLITLALLFFVYSNRNFDGNSIISIQELKKKTFNLLPRTDNANLKECVRDKLLLSKAKLIHSSLRLKYILINLLFEIIVDQLSISEEPISLEEVKEVLN